MIQWKCCYIYGGDEDFRKERYEHNVNMCLNEYPDRVFGKTNNIFKVISTILRKRLRLMFDDFDVNEETFNISVDDISNNEWADESDVEVVFG